MSELLEFIERTERSFFRTNQDTGANSNTLFIWNQLRKYAGLPELTHDDLRQRHVDSSDGMHSVEEAREFEKWFDLYSVFQNTPYQQRQYEEIMAKGGRDYINAELAKLRTKYDEA